MEVQEHPVYGPFFGVMGAASAMIFSGNFLVSFRAVRSCKTFAPTKHPFLDRGFGLLGRVAVDEGEGFLFSRWMCGGCLQVFLVMRFSDSGLTVFFLVSRFSFRCRLRNGKVWRWHCGHVGHET